MSGEQGNFSCEHPLNSNNMETPHVIPSCKGLSVGRTVERSTVPDPHLAGRNPEVFQRNTM